VAPDHRGYGRSGGTDVTFDDSLWHIGAIRYFICHYNLTRATV